MRIERRISLKQKGSWMFTTELFEKTSISSSRTISTNKRPTHLHIPPSSFAYSQLLYSISASSVYVVRTFLSLRSPGIIRRRFVNNFLFDSPFLPPKSRFPLKTRPTECFPSPGSPRYISSSESLSISERNSAITASPSSSFSPPLLGGKHRSPVTINRPICCRGRQAAARVVLVGSCPCKANRHSAPDAPALGPS